MLTLDPFEDMVVADFGNAPIDIMSTERSMHAIRSFVRSAAEVEIEPGKHVVVIVLGLRQDVEFLALQFFGEAKDIRGRERNMLNSGPANG